MWAYKGSAPITAARLYTVPGTLCLVPGSKDATEKSTSSLPCSPLPGLVHGKSRNFYVRTSAGYRAESFAISNFRIFDTSYRTRFALHPSHGIPVFSTQILY